MIKFFRKIRQKLFSEGKTGNYLKYAIGEVILVMIGILLALQVNNWNENRKVQKEIREIYNQIIFELDNDIDELSENLNMYESIKSVFDNVVSDSRTVDLLDDGLSRIIASSPNTVLNKSGVERLRTISVNDSLSLKVIEMYESLEWFIRIEQTISESQRLIVINYKDNYSWYPEWINKRITKENSSQELQDYFVNSQEYRHNVIYSYQQVYNRYVPRLRRSIPQIKQIRNELQNAINK
ncbi:DUF6090 family protein [Olleya aquimaris]|uniref:Uncharacterized protein n=1 Tax=Olleya aquimaris TaxID=639310 RepID=A0A327R8F8_9FLAO|nr:DUF6090 family protein [Olleya aquimaris]RAJ13186.1 hypothetical protein LY08_02085 [Olleya aquimaris]